MVPKVNGPDSYPSLCKTHVHGLCTERGYDAACHAVMNDQRHKAPSLTSKSCLRIFGPSKSCTGNLLEAWSRSIHVWYGGAAHRRNRSQDTLLPLDPAVTASSSSPQQRWRPIYCRTWQRAVVSQATLVWFRIPQALSSSWESFKIFFLTHDPSSFIKGVLESWQILDYHN